MAAFSAAMSYTVIIYLQQRTSRFSLVVNP